MTTYQEAKIFEHPKDIGGAPDFFISYINQLTGGLWGTAIVSIIFAVIFMSLQKLFDPKEAFAAASFAAMVSSILLKPLGAVSDMIVVLTVLMTVLAALIQN